MENLIVITDQDADDEVIGTLTVDHSTKETQKEFLKYKNKYEDDWSWEGFLDYLIYDLEWKVGWDDAPSIMSI